MSPAGLAELAVEGETASAIGGVPIQPSQLRLPELHYELFLVAGAHNSLPRPVLLPRLNPANDVLYDGSSEVVLTVEGVAGVEMRVAAGTQVTLPDGSVVDASNPVTLSLNAVHVDEVPMPLPDGAASSFAWTLQPGGATFDPPVQVTLPNMSGLPAGAASYFLSFDHDTNQFEIVAPGAVSADGSVIVSDPGTGIAKAGWGGNCPPYSVTGSVERCIPDSGCESGELKGGMAEALTPAVCKGQMIRFQASGVTDSGGTQFVSCAESSSSMTIPPGEVTYTYTIDVPFGDPITGEGDLVEIPSSQTGEYTCTFTASVSRSCAPGPLDLEPVVAKVVDVIFAGDANQLYGFDNFSLGQPYKSLEDGDFGDDQVIVDVLPPSAAEEVMLVADSPALVSISPAELTSAPATLTLTPHAAGEVEIEARLETAGGKACSLLTTVAYPRIQRTLAVMVIDEYDDDVQVIPKTQGEPDTLCVEPLPGSSLASVPGGDDQVLGDAIFTGPNGICETAAAFPDVQLIPVGNGLPGTICVTEGDNGVRDTAPDPMGDDVIVGETLSTGPNGICETFAEDFTLPSGEVGSVAELEDHLNNVIYNQAIVSWDITELASMELNYDLDVDGVIASDGSEDELIINSTSALVAGFDQVVYLVGDMETGTLGFAQHGQKYAFVSIPNHDNSSSTVKDTIAHELGHAFGALEHTPEDPENLMHPNNPGVCKLRKPQWDQLHGVQP